MAEGFKDFAPGDILTAADVDDYLMRQAVMRFADASARTTALSGVLVEGMMSYLKDTDAVEVYDGTSWVAVGGASTDVVVEYLVIGGGGGTGTAVNGRTTGGGGAGGYVNSYGSETSGGGSTTAPKASMIRGTSYTVTVGAGGAGAPASLNAAGSLGGTSSFGGVTALGGGASTMAGNPPTWYLTAVDGASGAGMSRYNDHTGITLMPTQGYDGGDSDSEATTIGVGTSGGGGGAGEAGNTDGQGSGGDGLSSSITGSAVVRGGGGSGSTFTSGADIPGGDGGGGDGRDGGASAVGDPGDANTGGGGGGTFATGGATYFAGANGGSGVVIIRFLTSAGSPTIGAGLTSSSSTDGDYTVIEFTAGSDTISWSV
jgi:hypothetical protein